MNHKISVLIAVILFPLLAAAQSPSINQFYRKHKRDDGAINATLPGWVIKLGVGIARPFVDDEEIKVGLRMTRKVRKAKFLVMEEESRISQGEYMQLVRAVKKDRYEELVQIRDEGENVAIFAREKKDYISRLLILVREEDSFVLLSLKTKLKPKHINKAINDILELQKEKKENKVVDDESPVT
ncbi:MAG: DUF4252 domain-containing protein [Saprospiraceae bacterium]